VRIVEVMHPVCCGIDVHKSVLVACIRRDLGGGKIQKETRSFATTLPELKLLAAWLAEQVCPVVAMESTGVYWRPVYHVLHRSFQVVVGNPRDMTRRPGKKTDKIDADWISELLAHGLIAPSFIPDPQIHALRDLTRLRVTLVQSRSQSKNRVHKILEDTNIKLSSVVTDLFGVSGRKMLNALITGERDSQRLAHLAVGTLKKKIPQLEVALQGNFTEHHAAIIKMSVDQVDLLDRQIRDADERIAELSKPHDSSLQQLDSIPGVDLTAALAIVGEIGTDMTRFGSDKRLASWTGVCPGNNESAGKRKSGKTRRGNRWLRRVLSQTAWAARKTDTFLGRTFRSLQARIGGKKAALAVGHKILVVAYHLLANGTTYDETRYLRSNPKLEARWRNNAVRTLERLGFSVTLEALPAPA
jgi:transposase